MADEASLRENFPGIPWDQPVKLSVLCPTEVEGGGRVFDARSATTSLWVCRYCIAMYGVNASRMIQGPRPRGVFETKKEALAHIAQEHHA